MPYQGLIPLDSYDAVVKQRQAVSLSSDYKYAMRERYPVEAQPLGVTPETDAVIQIISSRADTRTVTIYGRKYGNISAIVSASGTLNGTTAVEISATDTWYEIHGAVASEALTDATGLDPYIISIKNKKSGLTICQINDNTTSTHEIILFSPDAGKGMFYAGDVMILSAAELDYDGPLVLNDRVSTMTLAGSVIDLTSSYAYTDMWNIRCKVTDWTGIGTSFGGYYFRTENRAASASAKELHGMQLYVADYSAQVASGNGLSLMHGLLVDMLIKPGNATASNPITIASGYAGEFCISPEAKYNTLDTITITNWLACLQLCPSSNARITGGNLAKLHGIKMLIRDGDGQSSKLGSGVEIISDTAQSGTRTLTTGFLLGIGATTGISMTGAMTTGISITGNATTAIIANTGTIRKFFDSTCVTTAGNTNCATLNITDGTGSTTFVRGMHINNTLSGAKTGSGEFDGLDVDCSITAAYPYIFGIASYMTSPSGNPTLGFVVGLSSYSDDLGSGCGAYVGVDIGMNFANAPTGRHAFVRIRNHSTTITPKSVFEIENQTTEPAGAQLFYFWTNSEVPVVSTGCNVTVATVPYLKVLVGAVQYGIPLIAI